MSTQERLFPLSQGRDAVHRLISLSALLLALLLAGAAGLLAMGSQALDSFEARKSQTIMSGLASSRLSRVANDVGAAATALAPYRLLGLDPRSGPDLDDFLIGNRSLDRSVVLDGSGHVLRARSRRAPVDRQGPADFLAQAAPLVAQARHAAVGAVASGVIMTDGVPYLAAASRLPPPPRGISVGPGPIVVVAGQRVAFEVPGSAQRFGVLGGRVVGRPDPQSASTPLRDIGGRIVGYIAWPRQHPGVTAVREAAPLLAGGFLLLAVIVAAVGWQVVRVTRRLLAYERAWGAAMQDLSDARDRAEAANVAKSQFLANMSHEIRTPLNGVLGMTQALSRSDLAPDDRDKLQLIRTSGENLLILLNDLLDLSKIEAGFMELDVHDFDLDEVIRAAAQPFAEIAAQKDLRFVVEIDEAARGVWRGDGGRIRQLVGNLASNAVKFTENGEVRVAVSRTVQGLACRVSDTGIGIADDRIDQLFQRFAQIDPTATRRAGGTGLGLAICRDLAALMGGQVSVASTLGEGSTFAFEVPLVWVGPAAAAAPEPCDGFGGIGPLRVLAAEDNGVNRVILSALLEPFGVQLRLAADGREAVDAFDAEPFDLVLMDVQMPVMNGVEATRAIRRREAETGRTPTPILALSANVMPHQVAEYLAAGMDGLIAKPIEVRAMLETIRKALAGRGQVGEAMGAEGGGVAAA